jgi:DNA-binding beta-propeller fold protein YncE
MRRNIARLVTAGLQSRIQGWLVDSVRCTYPGDYGTTGQGAHSEHPLAGRLKDLATRTFREKEQQMKPRLCIAIACAVACVTCVRIGQAGQPPFGANAPQIPITSHDRVYKADQTSNTISVYDPSSNSLLGVIPLGGIIPNIINPLYGNPTYDSGNYGQVLVHGMGFSFDYKTLDVVSIVSNSVTFIDTATNAIKHITYVGRSPHEVFHTPDDSEVWVTVRGEDYVQVIDGRTYKNKDRIFVGDGPGMTIFRPDGKYGYVCSSFVPETVVVDVKSHKIVATVPQPSPFCPNISATPDGQQVWFTLKDTGKTEVFNARPPFNVWAILDTGPITNHVNIVRNMNGQFAYVTVGGENVVKVYTTTNTPQLVATIPVGELPHGLWPSGDGTRIYINLENGTGLQVIDTLSNQVIATLPGGQAGQALVYVPTAVPTGNGLSNLVSLGSSGQSVHLFMGPPGSPASAAPTTVTLNNQGPIDLLEAAVTGLQPDTSYTLGYVPDLAAPGQNFQPLNTFTTNAAGAQIAESIGVLRELLAATPQPEDFLVIVPAGSTTPVQVQLQ